MSEFKRQIWSDSKSTVEIGIWLKGDHGGWWISTNLWLKCQKKFGFWDFFYFWLKDWRRWLKCQLKDQKLVKFNQKCLNLIKINLKFGLFWLNLTNFWWLSNFSIKSGFKLLNLSGQVKMQLQIWIEKSIKLRYDFDKTDCNFKVDSVA